MRVGAAYQLALLPAAGDSLALAENTNVDLHASRAPSPRLPAILYPKRPAIPRKRPKSALKGGCPVDSPILSTVMVLYTKDGVTNSDPTGRSGGVPALVGAVASPLERVRRAACWGAGAAGPAAVRPLLPLLAHAEQSVVTHAAAAIGFAVGNA